MVLAIILDGIPESIVIGLGLFEGGKVSIAMLAAVFISNMPEAIAGSTGMKAGGWSRKKIILLWVLISVVCAAATIAGFTLFSGASVEWLSFIQAFAGGAILMMLANSITLTPGTITVDIKDDTLYIHWIDVTSTDIEEATKNIVTLFEKYLEVMYG